MNAPERTKRFRNFGWIGYPLGGATAGVLAGMAWPAMIDILVAMMVVILFPIGFLAFLLAASLIFLIPYTLIFHPPRGRWQRLLPVLGVLWLVVLALVGIFPASVGKIMSPVLEVMATWPYLAIVWMGIYGIGFLSHSLYGGALVGALAGIILLKVKSHFISRKTA